MGVIIDYSGSFANEKSEVEELKATMDQELQKINTCLNNLKPIWVDAVSNQYLNSIISQVDELTSANTKCKTAADGYMDNIEAILNRFGISG